jgi:rod shape-determining protein MreB
VPSQVTEVEQRSVRDATKKAGAREVFVIEEPIAAAIGAGIDISRPQGSMVIDIGGGTTDVAVISLGGCVVNESVKVAGDHFDEAIIRFMRRKYNMLIGERTAEDLKITIGSAFDREPLAMDIRGRNLINGLPRTITVTTHDMLEALSEPIAAIIDTIHRVLEQTPPELASDLTDRGLVMTGGSSLLYGLDKLITHKTGIRAVVADDAVSAVAFGTGKYIEYMTSHLHNADNITKTGIIRPYANNKRGADKDKLIDLPRNRDRTRSRERTRSKERERIRERERNRNRGDE